MKRYSCPRGNLNCAGVRTNDYYSAEFVVDGLEVSYQFKIWEKAPRAVSVLVKENSDLLQLLKVWRYAQCEVLLDQVCLSLRLEKDRGSPHHMERSGKAKRALSCGP